MNVFSRILFREAVQSVRLGNPLGRDSGPFLARMATMASMTGGRGFTVPAKTPRKNSQGQTRGDLKRAMYAHLFLSA